MLDFKNVRIPWQGVNYPPYHQGPYMEEYFYNCYIQNKSKFDSTGYTLLPIFWTTAYLLQIDIDPYIRALPKNLKYFCVAQHDDGVKEELPEGTKVFSAGGNSGGIPLPLVCSPLPKTIVENTNKDIFCSFVGSNTHSVRQIMFDTLKDDALFYIKSNEWSWHIDQAKQTDFLATTARSKFTLCPRGYGAQSFRFYEALQLGSIPVYIHNGVEWTPYSDIIDWKTFSVVLHIDEISSLKDILCSFTDKQILDMKEAGKAAYENYFALHNLPQHIINNLTQNNHGLGSTN